MPRAVRPGAVKPVRPDYNPWAHAQDLGVTVRYHASLRGIWGCTDRDGVVWISRDLSSRETRSTLAHELVHVELGHRSPQPKETEDLVDLIAALRLVDENAWRWARRRGRDVEAIAVLLDIDESQVRVLLRHGAGPVSRYPHPGTLRAEGAVSVSCRPA